MNTGTNVTIIGIAVERRRIYRGRTALIGRDAAIRYSSVSKVFISPRDLCPIAWREGQCRRNTGTLEVNSIPKAVGVPYIPFSLNANLSLEADSDLP